MTQLFLMTRKELISSASTNTTYTPTFLLFLINVPLAFNFVLILIHILSFCFARKSWGSVGEFKFDRGLEKKSTCNSLKMKQWMLYTI